jgi:ABC-type sugar transport system permease subunit
LVGEAVAEAVSPSTRPRRSRGLGSYLMILPAAGFIAVIFLYPLVRLIEVSLHTGSRGTDGPATLDNYRFVLEDEVFWKAARHNLALLLAVPVATVLALAIALVLFEGIRFWRTYRTFVFVPYVLSVPVLGASFLLLYGLHGVLNRMLGGVGLGGLAQDWFGNPDWTLPSIASLVVYHEVGFGVVLFLARLLTLSPEPFDAARVDGASWWRVQRFVTLPQLRSVIVTYVVLELITMLSWVFAYVYSTTRGGPNFASYILELYVYDNAFTFQSPSFAAAVAVLLLVPTTIVIALWLRRSKIAEVNLE